MDHLVGRIFSLADGDYRIVDVQRLGGDALIYAEQQRDCVGTAADDGGPVPRSAFHYGDIAELLEQSRGAL